MKELCFDCAIRGINSDLSLIIEGDKETHFSTSRIPELVDGVCPECGGTNVLEPEDIEG